jgi:PAS domain S-box-containing protein
MNKLIRRNETRDLRWVIAISGGSAVLAGLLALTGWITGVYTLTSINSVYIPMAQATAILSTGFGLVFLSGVYRASPGISRSLSLSVVCLFTLYGFLKFLEYFLKTNLTFDPVLFPVKETLGNLPVNRMSPIAGLLFFLCGIASIIKIVGRERLFMLNLVSISGIIVLFAGFTGFTGYLLGNPYNFGGDIIPLSLLTTVVFFVLGCGLVSMGGKESLILRPVSGNVASARILRAIIPIIIVALLADDFINKIFIPASFPNNELISIILGVLLIPLSIWIVIRVSQTIFQRADKAEVARRKAEAALLESEKRYRNLVENLGEGIALVDPDECFVYANPAAEQIFGVIPGGLVGRTLRDFLLPDQLSRVLIETVKRALGEPSSYEFDIINADKKVRSLFVTATPQMNNEGVFTGTFGVFLDITSRKQAIDSLRESEARLRELSGELQESNTAKDKLFSIVAHDLRSPFNSLLGLTQMLVEELPGLKPEEIQEIALMLRKSTTNLYKLLENLLEWSSLQRGLISFNPEFFPLRQKIMETIEVLAEPASKKKIDISCDVPAGIEVYAEKTMFESILRNLISNAIKFTHEKGNVSIIAESLSGHTVKISVSDTGIGMNKGMISNLFRLEINTNRKGTDNEPSTGLGLVICKELIEKHGGKLWVESEEGKGSTFYFTLQGKGIN